MRNRGRTAEERKGEDKKGSVRDTEGRRGRRSSHGRIERRLLRWSADGGGVGMDK